MRHLASADVRDALRQDPLLAVTERAAERALTWLGRGVIARLRAVMAAPLVLRRMEERTRYDAPLCAQPLRGVRHSSPRAQRELGCRPPHSFDESMRAFRAWYRTTHGVDTGACDLLRRLG